MLLDPRKQSLIIMLVAAVLSLFFITYLTKVVTGATNREITYNEFIKLVDEGSVESVKIEMIPVSFCT